MREAMGACLTCMERGVRTQAVVLLDGDGYCAPCARTGGVVAVASEPERVAPIVAPVVETPQKPEALRGERLRPVERDPLCSRGCGKLRHRGNCPRGCVRTPVVREVKASTPAVNEAGAVRAAAVIKPLTRMGKVLDEAVAEEVSMDDLPTRTKPERKAMGRIGQLWERLRVLPAGRALKVENRDVSHAGLTRSHLKRKALMVGRGLMTRRDGTDLFCWLVAGDEGAR